MPEQFGVGRGGTVWYEFTAASDGLVEVNTFGSDYDTYLFILSGDSIVACNAQAPNSNGSQATLRGHVGGDLRHQDRLVRVCVSGMLKLSVVEGVEPPPPPEPTRSRGDAQRDRQPEHAHGTRDVERQHPMLEGGRRRHLRVRVPGARPLRSAGLRGQRGLAVWSRNDGLVRGDRRGARRSSSLATYSSASSSSRTPRTAWSRVSSWRRYSDSARSEDHASRATNRGEGPRRPAPR